MKTIQKVILIILFLALMVLAVVVWNKAGFSQALPTLQVTLPYVQPLLHTAGAVLKGTPTPRQMRSLPLPTPDPRAISGLACFTSLDRGITCLDDRGWQVFSRESSLASDQIRDLAVCPDGSLLAVTSLGVTFFDGEGWFSSNPENYLNLTAGTCDAQGNWWIAHTRGISQFDGVSWIDYPSSLFLPEGSGQPVLDIAASPDGDIWLVLGTKIVRMQGADWQVFGSDDLAGSTFEAVQIDPDGQPWVIHHDGILRFDGADWLNLTPSGFPYTRALAFASADHVFAATNQGLWVFREESWQQFTSADSPLRRDDLYTVALDGQGRLWLGSDWGVDVLNGMDLTTYFMYNSSLQDDQVRGLVTIGAGPQILPARIEKAPATLSGRILQSDGRPLAKARLELCTGTARLRYYDTLCEEQPFRQAARTSGDGTFLFEDLPEGLYLLAVETSPGNWSLLRTSLGAPDRILVQSGLANDLSDLLLP